MHKLSAMILLKCTAIDLTTAASGSTLGTGFTCIGANRVRNGT